MLNEHTERREPYGYVDVHKRISWTAIFVGALVGVGLGFLINIFGIAIGLSALTISDAGQATFAIGGFIGLVIGVIATMLTAGYAAGYLGRLYCPGRNLGIVYGFSTWTLALILTVMITAPLSSYLSTQSNLPNVVIAETQSAQGGDTTVEVQSNNNANEQGSQASAEVSTIAWGGFMVFILFFIGALSACFGAIWGMSCKRDD